ncbi:hypothetical protein RFI_06793 [Reticulomyxa filosa]|uniref:Protein-PII uridylyltransferase N-terminal domain-containing protein n=1 Tax=Reticulomyxa filosa TaxID=46433 RepID=X6NWS5_RETFI|nr:hypothetical protein RFI_06793 [Reticulomyxa filosa]|eukprot:ETO30328.1 hypothetical protein RFI_06793 [Reticulomyxa filosa]
MATKPKEIPASPTGEDWIKQDKPKELLNWLTQQKEPMKCSQKLILYALRLGKWNCASELLKMEGTLLQTRDSMKQNILFYWADGLEQNKKVEEAIEWLNENISLEAIIELTKEENEEGSNILHAVSVAGQYKILQWIFNRIPGLNINGANNYGYTALHKACRHGQMKAIVWLLKHGSDISMVTINGDRPEHELIKCEHIELVPYVQPPIDWPKQSNLAINSDIQISLQAKYDRAQAIRLSFPKKSLSKTETIEYHSNQLSLCCSEYESLIVQTVQSVPQLAILCLLSLSDAILSHLFWAERIEIKSSLYRRAMGYATIAWITALNYFNLPNALLWQKYAASQRIRILSQILPTQKVFHSNYICGFLAKVWSFIIDRLSPPPCQYTLLLLGSFGRKEATAYSDIECACLIEEDNIENRTYFINVSSIFEIVLIGLGETPEELLTLFTTCNKTPQVMRDGLHADYFYMPHRTPDLLLHTPINLANIQRSHNWSL